MMFGRRRQRRARDLADVAGRGDDEDTGIDELLRPDRERITVNRIEHRGERIRIRQVARRLHAEREIDDADVLGGVVLEHPLECADDAVDRAGAVGAEHAEGVQRRARSHSRFLAVGIDAVAGNRARDVRAVPVGIARGVAVQVRGFVRRVRNQEVVELGDRRLEVRHDARVEHGNAHTRAVDPHHAPREKRAALNAGPEIEGVNGGVDACVERVGVQCERLQLAVGDVEHVAVLTGASRAGVFLELRRQLPAFDVNDDARRLRGRRGGRAKIQLRIEPGVLHLRAGDRCGAGDRQRHKQRVGDTAY